MPSNVSAGASNGTSVGLNILLVWALWQFFGISLPNEVAIAITGIVATCAHAFTKWLENRYQIDLNGNGQIGNGGSASTPTEGKPA